MATFLVAVMLLTVWTTTIAVLSVQNATLISLRFLAWRSVQIPLGVVLAFCAVGAALLAALGQVLWPLLVSAAARHTEDRR